MKILHWRDRNGNEQHGEPIDDIVCDDNAEYSNTKYAGKIHHWTEYVPEQNNSEGAQ